MNRVHLAGRLTLEGASGGIVHSHRIPRPHVAIIDGRDSRRDKVMASLAGFYHVVGYGDALAAYAGMRLATPDILIVDESLPPQNAFEFVSRLRRDPAFPRIPAIIVSSDDQLPTRQAVAECGGDFLLVRPLRRAALLHAISAQINRVIEGHWETLPAPQREALKGTVEAFRNLSETIERGEPIPFEPVRTACQPLVKAVNTTDVRSMLAGVRQHDDYSYAHSLRVATFLALFGYAIGLTEAEQSILAAGGLLHDVGKTAVPLAILNKAGRLNAPEYEVMKGHVLASGRYLRNGRNIPRGVLVIAEQHHEKLDGSGYPYGLKASQLNDLARMASIVDVFVALTDRRVYKPPLDAERALCVMTLDMGGRHLDRHFLRLFRETLLDAAAEVTGTLL